jgi:hypothetical protein
MLVNIEPSLKQVLKSQIEIVSAASAKQLNHEAAESIALLTWQD